MKTKVMIAGLLSALLAMPVYAGDEEQEVRIVKKVECEPQGLTGLGAEIDEEIELVMEELHEVLGNMHHMDEDRAFMGVLLDDDGKGSDRGVQLIGVTPGGAAQEAGLQAGDIILAVNGVSMAQGQGKVPNEHLVGVLKGLKPGDEVAVIIDRDGEAKEFEFDLGSYQQGHREIANVVKEYQFRGPEGPGGMHKSKRYFRHAGKLGGLNLAPVNEGLGSYFGTDKGLLVLSTPTVEGVKLQAGDVIVAIGGRDPKTPEKAWRIIASYDRGEAIPMKIMRQKQMMDLEIVRP
ncbi:MAG: PDZ domain-containing protein [bacterium]